MIKKSFIFLERISNKKEQAIHRQNINDWNDFLKAPKIRGINLLKKAYYDRQIHEAQKALLEEKSYFFINRLPQKEMWRLYDEFKDQACFLDIEIGSDGKVILVGISNYYRTNTFICNINLDKSLLEKELQKYKLLITFNGSAFDLPKLKKELQIEIKIPHIDLKPLCVNLNLKGGLKEVEKILNLKRPPHLNGNPVDLWKAYHASGDKEYLDLMIQYNNEDIENLKGVMEYVYKELSNKMIVLSTA